MTSLDPLLDRIKEVLGPRATAVTQALGECTVEVQAQHYVESALLLKNTQGLQYEQLIDLCGVDYSTHENEQKRSGPRFAVVLHLLSVSLNQRLRLRVFCPEKQGIPQLDSLISVWSAADWFEREAFDLYGVVFKDHPDLRRILTDYGFIGHPLRKDFPLVGNVEMIYDEKMQRVKYQAVTIEQREITPRVVREDHYGGLD